MTLPRKSKIIFAAGMLLVLPMMGFAQEPAPSPNLKLIESAGQKVPVELEWEEIPGARHYELEFQDLSGKVLNTFKSTSNVFKFKFKVGKYIVRSRVGDVRKVFGDWSEATEFAIQPKPAFVNSKSVTTAGVIDPKTLTSEVALRWGEAPGAAEFRVRILNEKKEVVKETTVKGFSYKAELPAGVYTVELTSMSANGIASEPVVLPEKVTIQSVQLPKPEIIFEEVVDAKNPEIKTRRLPQVNETPVLRLNPNSLSEPVGYLDYCYFFSEEWQRVGDINAKVAGSKEIILESAKKPGRYRLTVWAEARGLNKSESVTYEFVVKPTAY